MYLCASALRTGDYVIEMFLTEENEVENVGKIQKKTKLVEFNNVSSELKAFCPAREKRGNSAENSFCASGRKSST